MSEINVRQATAAEAGRIAGFNRAMAMETEGLALDEQTVASGVVALLGHPERGFYLVAELTARGGIELVERQAIRRVLDEQSQALQQDSSGVAVGKLLRADVIGVLETTPDGKEAGGFAVLDMADFQGTSVMNECDGEVPWTRTHEFKHFTPELSFERTVIFREYSFDPGSEDDLYYPVRTAADLAIHAKYIKEAAGVPHVHFGGRLGAYAYLDMENTVSTALEQYERLRAEGGSAPGGA